MNVNHSGPVKQPAAGGLFPAAFYYFIPPWGPAGVIIGLPLYMYFAVTADLSPCHLKFVHKMPIR